MAIILPVKVKTIMVSGGACPWQVEGTTAEGHYFYIRYRGGRLRGGVAETDKEFWNQPNPYNVIDILHGDHLDGWAYHDEIVPLLEGKFEFSNGFRLES